MESMNLKIQKPQTNEFCIDKKNSTLIKEISQFLEFVREDNIVKFCHFFFCAYQ